MSKIILFPDSSLIAFIFHLLGPDAWNVMARGQNQRESYFRQHKVMLLCPNIPKPSYKDRNQESKEILHAERKITLRSKILSGRVVEERGKELSLLSTLARMCSLLRSLQAHVIEKANAETRARILLRTVTIILLRQDLLNFGQFLPTMSKSHIMLLSHAKKKMKQ